ncbi:MAG: glycoside hydrolase family 127 protein [Bacilli bacterium]|nr:glycoside hydrolase family 127 protein [Bacilli bacterium]
MHYDGIISFLMNYINHEQLLNKSLWNKFTSVFTNRDDDKNLGWRAEYWGKMMRGACLCYQYQHNKQLYQVLEKTVKDLLKKQDHLGRISSYSTKNEFRGWDIWGRKYVLTGLLHFANICENIKLKKKIISALEKHTDYIIDHVGKEKGKIPITHTSHIWLGVNSCSILESIVALYQISHKAKYLKFAKYIVETGGIKGGNLITSANNDKLLPYQYLENKAYETMSFFEGVLEYALVSKDNQLVKTAINFFEKVQQSEISIIGNAGSEDENFSHGALRQTYQPKKFMQETCVVTTYMRIMAKLHLLTGDIKYYERFSTAALNCFLGSVNNYHNCAKDYFNKKVLKDYLPFDSYSPLVNSSRGVSTGGLQFFKDHSFYGCCASIGSASIGLMALCYVINNRQTIVFNDYYDNGTITTKGFKAIIKSNYIESGRVHLIIKKNSKEILLRIPSWSNKPSITINGKVKFIKAGTYYKVNLTKGDILLNFNPEIKTHHLNQMIAFSYGQFVLGIDEESNPHLKLESLKADNIKLTKTKTNKNSLLTFTNENKLIFKDYASLGKHYNIKRNRLSVWINQ